MVTVYRRDDGKPFAIDVRPDARVSMGVSARDGVVEIRFVDSSKIPLTLILPQEVAWQVLGPWIDLLPRHPTAPSRSQPAEPERQDGDQQ